MSCSLHKYGNSVWLKISGMQPIISLYAILYYVCNDVLLSNERQTDTCDDLITSQLTNVTWYQHWSRDHSASSVSPVSGLVTLSHQLQSYCYKTIRLVQGNYFLKVVLCGNLSQYLVMLSPTGATLGLVPADEMDLVLYSVILLSNATWAL